jgi:hypothetical protein
MISTMTDFTRDEAVLWLRARGLDANKRDWSFGESVVAGANVQALDGVVGWGRCVCLHPWHGQWAVSDFSRPCDDLVPCGTLQEAVRHAAAVLEAR